MGLDATTFILEIVNFLVLLWLLTRFLYRPLQAAIASRQEQYEQARQALQAERTELDSQRTQLAAQLSGQAAQLEATQRQLASEIDAERTRRLADLNTELAAERTKAEARLAARLAQRAQQQENEVAQRADAYLRSYLQRLAGPELERAIIRLFLADLAALPEEQCRQLQASMAEVVELASAYEMDESLHNEVESAITTKLGASGTFRWQHDPGLIAGLAVRLDGHLLEASLAKSLDAIRAMPCEPNQAGAA